MNGKFVVAIVVTALITLLLPIVASAQGCVEGQTKVDEWDQVNECRNGAWVIIVGGDTPQIAPTPTIRTVDYSGKGGNPTPSCRPVFFQAVRLTQNDCVCRFRCGYEWQEVRGYVEWEPLGHDCVCNGLDFSLESTERNDMDNSENAAQVSQMQGVGVSKPDPGGWRGCFKAYGKGWHRKRGVGCVYKY